MAPTCDIPFRAHMSAAPLKRFSVAYTFATLAFLPRSHERGPIEADSLPLRTRRQTPFRAHMSAAPLKPEEGREAELLVERLPRSHERGPIEARVTSSASSP